MAENEEVDYVSTNQKEYVGMNTVEYMTGISAVSLFTMISQCDFPRPVTNGDGMAWRLPEVVKWSEKLHKRSETFMENR